MPEQGLLSLKGTNSNGEWQVPMKSPQQQHLTQSEWSLTTHLSHGVGGPVGISPRVPKRLTLELWWASACPEAFPLKSACKRIVGKIRAHVKWDSRSCITWGAKLATHQSFRNRKLWLPLLSAVRLLKSVSNKFNLQVPNIQERKIKFTRSAFWLA